MVNNIICHKVYNITGLNASFLLPLIFDWSASFFPNRQLLVWFRRLRNNGLVITHRKVQVKCRWFICFFSHFFLLQVKLVCWLHVLHQSWPLEKNAMKAVFFLFLADASGESWVVFSSLPHNHFPLKGFPVFCQPTFASFRMPVLHTNPCSPVRI